MLGSSFFCGYRTWGIVRFLIISILWSEACVALRVALTGTNVEVIGFFASNDGYTSVSGTGGEWDMPTICVARGMPQTHFASFETFEYHSQAVLAS